MRLPTEIEWEYAAKGGSKGSTFSYSGGNINEVAWYMENFMEGGNEGTHPVGQKKPNQLGLYDMSGNVAEWCADWYRKVYNNGEPEKAGGQPYKTTRGGGWVGQDWEVLVYSRFPSHASNEGSIYVGFRCVRDK